MAARNNFTPLYYPLYLELGSESLCFYFGLGAIIINRYLTKEYKLIAIICISLTFAVFIVKWARSDEPEFRPLLQDMRLVDAVEIADVLDRNSIDYFADVESHMLYVNQEQSVQARIELAKIGIVIEYPRVVKEPDLQKAYAELNRSLDEANNNTPVHQQSWFLRLVRLVMGTVVLIVLIITVIRPALAAIVLSDEEK